MEVATLIGDVVGSRQVAQRRQLQHEIDASLARVNESLSPVQPIRSTIGDEFQGAFACVSDAVTASLCVQLELLTGPFKANVRFGLGWGRTDVFDAERPIPSQDGEAWWTARDAIDRSKVLQHEARTKFVSACFGPAPSAPWGSAVDAYLGLRDRMVWGMSRRQLLLLLHMTNGANLNVAAEREGISPSGAFQALERSGGFALLDAASRFGGGNGR